MRPQLFIGLGAGYPYGWTKSDIDLGVDVARSVDASPRDVFALWYSESGLNPKIVSPAGYYGLIQGRADTLGPQWVSIVQNNSIADQLETIARVWQSSAQQMLGESYASRARRLGVTTPAMIYAMNLTPAYAKNMRAADQPMLIRNGGPDGGAFYAGNPGFDHQQKGYITIRDLEDHIAMKRRQGETTAPVSAIFAALPQDSVLSSFWRKPAGKAVIVTAGGLAAITAAFYVAYGRLPTRRDIGV
jgi:hypothetical protein